MRPRALAAVAAALALLGCAERTEIAPGVTAAAMDAPVPPGGVRFGFAPLDAERWSVGVRQGAPDGSVRYGFSCRVLVCPEPATVIVVARPSPVERPDPRALEQIARKAIPDLARGENRRLAESAGRDARLTTLASEVTTVQGHPAVESETRLRVGGLERYVAVSTVFAGRLFVSIRAEAGDRATARAALDEFAAALRIEEGRTRDLGS